MRDWLFNTNESHGKNAHNQMMAQSAVALYGYPSGVGEQKLARPSRGDRVFAYVNQFGVVAIGTFDDERVRPSRGIFYAGAEREYRRNVQWTCVVNPERGIRFETVCLLGCRLPVRCTIADITKRDIGDRLERELLKRGDDRLSRSR